MEEHVSRNVCEAGFRDMLLFIDEAKPHPPSLLKVPAFGTSIKNIPHQIHEKELFDKLKNSFPEVFNHDDVTCQKYTSQSNMDGTQRTIAVISGARGELRVLQRQALTKPLVFGCKTFNYVFLPDFGVARSSTGKRLNPVNGTAFHTIREREGPQQRVGLKLFSAKFLASIPQSLLNHHGPTTLYVKHPNLVSSDLPNKGSYNVDRYKQGYRRVDSASLLEAMQLIRKMNSASIRGQGLVFQNANCSIRSSCRDLKGLGEGGSLLEFDNFTHSIPLSWIDPLIKNEKFIKSFSLKCFRCVEPYVLVSTSCNLEYLMAKCGCVGRFLSYAEWNSKPVPENSPYHHPGEVLTRLAYFVTEKKEEKLIAYPYLKKLDIYYPSCQMMCNTLLPILEEEWRGIRDQSYSKKCKADVVEMEYLENLSLDVDMMIMHLDVDNTHFWNFDKATNFSSVKIACTVLFTCKIIPIKVHGVLRRVSKTTTGKLRLLYEVDWEKKYKMEGAKVDVIPIADKREYFFCRKYLIDLPHSFNDQANSSNILSKLFLNNGKVSTKTFIPLLTESISETANKIVQNLNPEQREAFQNAMESDTSVIQGPPGTGKSYLISSIALALAERNSGVVLCTASSNIACNVMYRQIAKIARRFKISVNICRVFSRGHELQLKRNEVDHKDSFEDSSTEETIRALHNLVAKDKSYLSGCKNLENISKLIESGKEYTMTRRQRRAYESHVRTIERNILAQQNIIVITNGCLAAYRLGKPRDGNADENDVETNCLSHFKNIYVLVDEAAVQSVTSLLPLETLKPAKIVMIGDSKQLCPHVISRAAEDAGLNRSMMELLFQDRDDCIVPMTMLREQFRAHPDLRLFTSYLSYGGELRDHSSIATRNEVVPEQFFDDFPSLQKHRVWVKTHNGKEKDIEKSKANDSEASIVLQTVKDFLGVGGLKPRDIVVLTPYDGQRNLIRQLLKRDGHGEVQCKCVDEFQGNEATCIIVSFTRSNCIDQLGFLMTSNRVNVCISRAREIMVICMNLEMIKKYERADGHLGKMYKFINEKCFITKEEVAKNERVKVKYC